MGSCISKCRPKRIKRLKPNCNEEDFSHVLDKLVISQVSVSPSPLLIHKPVSPSPSAASTTSFSSFSGATGSSGLSISSSLSTSCSSSSSSSLSISKDRSFSNEFLWSCAKKNPHIISRNLIRGKVHPQFLDPSLQERSVVSPLKQTYIPESPGGSTPKKRTRSKSPILLRQKSFRKEPDAISSSTGYHHPRRNLRSPSPSRRFSVEQSFGESTSRTLKSPSPSRRFNGDQGLRVSLTSTAKDIHSKTSVVSRTNLSKSSSSSSLRKESFRSSPSANIHSKDQNNILLKGYTDGLSRQIGNRIDENAAEIEKQGEDAAEDMIVEDFNNPLIAMDCFIFL